MATSSITSNNTMCPLVNTKTAEDPMTCELRVGDTVEVVLTRSAYAGTRHKVLSVPAGSKSYWVLQGVKWMYGKRSSLKLIERAGTAPMATPVQPSVEAKALKDKEFGEKGVMPSDHPGINEMLKKGFKEIFGGDLGTGASAPAKRTMPSNKALFITASEKYLGLGFNDTLGG